MKNINHKAVSRSSQTNPRPKTIQGLKVPSSIAAALRSGFSLNGSTTRSISLRGNREKLVGTAQFSQGGMGGLACPVTAIFKYDWRKLRATRSTSKLVWDN